MSVKLESQDLGLPPDVTVNFTYEDDNVLASTSAKVRRISWNDDGSLLVELDEWPCRTGVSA